MPHFPMAPADFHDYRAELQNFDGIAAYMRGDLQFGDAEQVFHIPKRNAGGTGDSGAYLEYLPVCASQKICILRDIRARTDEAHVADEHVD